MPETTEMSHKMRAGGVRSLAMQYREAQEQREVRYGALKSAMRYCRRQGMSLSLLSEASGLSVAQVQRICDLSKDRSE